MELMFSQSNGKRIAVPVEPRKAVQFGESVSLSEPSTTLISEINGGGITKDPVIPVIVKSDPIPRVTVPGSTAEVTYNGRVWDRETSATSVEDFQLSIDWGLVSLPESSEIEWVSDTPAIATVDSEGLVTHVSVGTAKIYARFLPEIESVGVDRTPDIAIAMTESVSSTVDVFKEFEAGSMMRDAELAVDSRIAGTDRDVARHLYTSFPSNSNYTDASETRGGVDEFIRNPNFWAADIDLSCISPSHIRSGESTHRRSPAATAISPWHWMSCHHSSFHPPINSKVYFLQMDGTLIYRTTIAKERVYYDTGIGSDLMVGLFDSALPAGVVPAKVLPTNYQSYLPWVSPYANKIPGLLLDQQEHGMVHDLNGQNKLGTWTYPTDAKRYEFVDQPADNRVWDSPGIELYDSGSPSFIIINGELVLITVWNGGFGGSGSDVTNNQAQVQSVMDSLSTANGKPSSTLTPVDLSSFNTY